ncbi:MAG: hypothetical protein HOP12_11185, partial [Candidatus Eisenbacteria bacterium]|nr:hypothetical protein [Candidatus Eisenbacteria bacterium]
MWPTDTDRRWLMSLLRRFIPAMVLLVIAAAAYASPPRNAAHVDPKAPCFRWPAIDVDGDGVFDRVDHCPNTAKGCSVDEWGCQTDADGDGVCDELDKCPGTAAGATVDEKGCADGQSTGRVEPRRE